jgi:hypothetical protein
MQKISFKYNGSLITVSVKDKFNRLTILDIFKDKVVCAKCQCECGKIIEKIVLRNLIDGNTKSCGCLNAELRQQRNFRHGDSTRNNKTRLYRIWQDMKRRCYNSTRSDAKNYCNKGIIVCDEWQSFVVFKQWALANGYTDELTIERKDNGLGYNPDNCCWIHKSEQSKNRTSNHYITYNNKTMTLTDWSKHLGIKRTTLSSRLRRGWTVEKAFTTN